MIRNRLKYWRHQHQMNQKEFTAFLEVNYYQYSRWERQEVQPDIHSLWKIKKKLGCQLDDLLEEDGSE